MLGFLIFLSVPLLAAFVLGAGAGGLGRVLPGSGAWRLLWTAAALVLPGLSLVGYLQETGQAALRVPEQAATMHTFQLLTALLFVLTAALTLWAGWRRSWLAPLPLPALFVAFFYAVLPPIYRGQDGVYDELLFSQLDGDTARGLFLACACGTALLTGMTVAARRKLTP